MRKYKKLSWRWYQYMYDIEQFYNIMIITFITILSKPEIFICTCPLSSITRNKLVAKIKTKYSHHPFLLIYIPSICFKKKQSYHIIRFKRYCGAPAFMLLNRIWRNHFRFSRKTKMQLTWWNILRIKHWPLSISFNKAIMKPILIFTICKFFF